MASITCLHQRKVYQVKVGMDLLRAFQLNPSLPFRFGCCQGRCGVCAIQVTHGHEALSKRTKQEEETLALKKLDFSYRLACQCALLGDITIS